MRTGLSHLPNLAPGLCETAGAAESTSQRSSGVTRATSTAWPPAAGCEKRPAQLSMAMTPCLPLQESRSLLTPLQLVTTGCCP